MSQDLISLTDEQLAGVFRALAELEAQLGPLDLDHGPCTSPKRLGGKSEAFCKQAIDAMARHPGIVPSGLDLAKAQADLSALERLRPFLRRLQRLTVCAQDIEVMVVNDALNSALRGYALLKAAGANEDLETPLKDLLAGITVSGREASPLLA